MWRANRFKAWQLHVRLLLRTWVSRVALGASIGAGVVFAFAALSSDVHSGLAHSGLVHTGLGWGIWLALLACFAPFAVALDREQAVSELIDLRGVAPNAQGVARNLAHFATVLGAFAGPPVLLTFALLTRADSVERAATAIVGFGAWMICGVVLAAMLLGLFQLSQWVSPKRSSHVLLALVFIPDILHEAMPELPSVLTLSDWLLRVASVTP